MSTPAQIHSSAYNDINTQINAMLSNNKQPAISIFSDEAGNVPVKDEAGNDIVNLNVTSISITQSYIDSVTNDPVNASLTIRFSDQSFKVVDGTDTYYYTISGTDFPLRTL